LDIKKKKILDISSKRYSRGAISAMLMNRLAAIQSALFRADRLADVPGILVTPRPREMESRAES